jgi:biopolymer transport protein ExbB/TolQ
MSLPAVVFLVVGLATAAILVVVAFGLLNHAKALSRAVADFRTDAEPLVAEIREQSERAQAQAATLQRRQEQLQTERERIRAGRQRAAKRRRKRSAGRG